MGGRAKLGGQVVAVGLVASLFVLLAWQLLRDDEEEGTLQGAAPGFTLPRLDAESSLSLASLRGKVVVLNFWASWCDPCEEESAELEAVWREYRARGLVVVGIDGYDDFDDDARAFARDNGMTYPLVQAQSPETARDYRVRGYPVTYVVDRDGRIVGNAFIGPVDGSDATRAAFRRRIERALATT